MTLEFPEEGVLETETDLNETHRKSPSSVIYKNYLAFYPDRYPAKFDPFVAKFLIEMYTEPGELVLDPFAGSGTIPIQATELGRNAIAIDVNPAAARLMAKRREEIYSKFATHGSLDIACSDAMKALPKLADNYADFCLTSPPFGIKIDDKHDAYSDNAEDIGNSKSYEEWRRRLKPILMESFRVLKPGRLMAVEMRPRSKDNKWYPLWLWITEDCLDIGFEYFCEYVEIDPSYKMWTNGNPLTLKPFYGHTFLLVFQKPENRRLL